MHITDKRTAIIIEALGQGQHDVQSGNSYGELGYTQPEKGILLANWNDIGQHLQDYLEEAGFELEWSDEWVIDWENDGKVYRTQPDSYGWVCQVAYNEHCDLLTPDSDVSDWIDHVAVTDPSQDVKSALPDFITDEQLADEGFTKVDEEYQNGWYYKQDNPTTVVEELWETVEDIYSVVFKIESSGQFHTNFTAYYSILD